MTANERRALRDYVAAVRAHYGGRLKTKSHATIIRGFGKHIVEERGFDRSPKRLFAQTEDARIGADYEDELLDEAAARRSLNVREGS